MEMTVAAREDETSSAVRKRCIRCFGAQYIYRAVESAYHTAIQLGCLAGVPVPPSIYTNHSGSSLPHPRIPMTLHACLRYRLAPVLT